MDGRCRRRSCPSAEPASPGRDHAARFCVSTIAGVPIGLLPPTRGPRAHRLREYPSMPHHGDGVLYYAPYKLMTPT